MHAAVDGHLHVLESGRLIHHGAFDVAHRTRDGLGVNGGGGARVHPALRGTLAYCGATAELTTSRRRGDEAAAVHHERDGLLALRPQVAHVEHLRAESVEGGIHEVHAGHGTALLAIDVRRPWRRGDGAHRRLVCVPIEEDEDLDAGRLGTVGRLDRPVIVAAGGLTPVGEQYEHGKRRRAFRRNQHLVPDLEATRDARHPSGVLQGAHA
eukprot:scaffold113293_cov48-Phaeocystis_antarctica.AAC.1